MANKISRISQKPTSRSGKNSAYPATAATPNSPMTGTVRGQPSTISTPTPYSASTSREHRFRHRQALLSIMITNSPYNLATTSTARTAPVSSPSTSTKSNQTGTTPFANGTVCPSTAATSTRKPTGNSSPRRSPQNLSAPRSSKA